MEIDAINSKLASRSTTALDQHRFAASHKPSRAIDISQEHTNGRMFEQAVQNANKAGETSAASSDNVKLSNSMIEGNADVRNENPLTLNQKEPRSLKEYAESETPEEEQTGETALKHALQVMEINYIDLSDASKDTIVVKGLAIDKFLFAETVEKSSDEIDDATSIKIGANSNVSERQQKRENVQAVAESAYHDMALIEAEEGNGFHSSVVQGLDKEYFGKEVTSILFDQQTYFFGE